MVTFSDPFPRFGSPDSSPSPPLGPVDLDLRRGGWVDEILMNSESAQFVAGRHLPQRERKTGKRGHTHACAGKADSEVGDEAFSVATTERC